MSSASDVIVFGGTMGGHFIEDINVHVPQNMTVVIPAEQAIRSHDLWRALSQRTLFRLHHGPPPGPMTMPALVTASIDVSAQSRELQETLAEQKELTAALRKQMAEQSALLETLVHALAQVQGQTAQVSSSEPRRDKASAQDVPTFIPATIKPENAETRINANMGEAEDSGLAESRSRLRNFRK